MDLDDYVFLTCLILIPIIVYEAVWLGRMMAEYIVNTAVLDALREMK